MDRLLPLTNMHIAKDSVISISEQIPVMISRSLELEIQLICQAKILGTPSL